MRKLFFLFLALVATSALWAEDFSVGGIYYNYLDGNNVEVTYRGSSSRDYFNEYAGEVIIPSTVTYNGTTYSVTSIGYRAFEYCSLRSITIPNSVTSIGDWAFAHCFSLTSITIPNSVTSIGDDTFYGCSSLTSVTIPNSVTSIGVGAFYGCSSLTTPVYNAHCFAYMPTSFKGDYVIPEGIKQIAVGAFYECSSLTSVTIPNSVTSIGWHAFEGCSSLVSMVVESGNTKYDSRDNCNAIIETATNILIAGCQNTIIPNSVTNIGWHAFEGCSSLTSVTIPNSVTSIGHYAFNNCSSLDTVTCLAMTPPALGENVFYGCDNPTLFVPCEALSDYQAHEQWGQFATIECIASEETETEEVVVESGTTTIIITWPTEEGADTYTIVIKKDGEVVCTLTFNSEGQLISIAFAPGRNGNHPAQYAEAVANGKGFRFTVTGLEEGTDYTYDITVKDASNQTIHSHTGAFTTQSTTAVDNITTTTANIQKIIRDGQLIILRDGKTYTIMGAQIQ